LHIEIYFRTNLPVKSYPRHIFRVLCRFLPLVIALLFVASQSMAVLHHVAHANAKSIAASGESGALQNSADPNTNSASQSHLSAHSNIWTALFGHSTDGAENTSACLAWDAAFASAAPLGDTALATTTVSYSVATFLPVSVPLVPTDFLGIALARAPPRA
jgi:hypothetical protein